MEESTVVLIQWASMIILQTINIVLYRRGDYRNADISLSSAYVIALLMIIALTI